MRHVMAQKSDEVRSDIFLNKKGFLITFAAENEEKLSFCITFFNRKNLF